MPDEFGALPTDPLHLGEGPVDPRAFPPGARVSLTDPSAVQLEDGTLVPISNFDDPPLPVVETNAGGFVHIEGHGWSDEELALRAANEQAGVQGERVSAENVTNLAPLGPGQALNLPFSGDFSTTGTTAEIQTVDGRPTLVAMTTGVQSAGPGPIPEPVLDPNQTQLAVDAPDEPADQADQV